jgi:hypothetical protein
MYHERLTDNGRERLLGLLRAGDPDGEVATTWQAKEAVRYLYSHTDAELALIFVEPVGKDMKNVENPIKVRSLGRTLVRWKRQFAAWHRTHVSNGPTEAVNNFIKRVKHAAFGFTSFTNYQIRSLLYAGKPNWSYSNPVEIRRAALVHFATISKATHKELCVVWLV